MLPHEREATGKTFEAMRICRDCRDWRRKMKMTSTALECTIRQFQRIDGIDDPVTRYKIPLEIMRITTDVSLCLGKMVIEDETELRVEKIEEEMPTDPEVIRVFDNEISKMKDESEKLIVVIEDLQKMFIEFGDKFSAWVSKPCYGPDRIVGKGMMDDAKEEFETLKGPRAGFGNRDI